MTSNILFVPFRRSHSVSMAAAMKQYIFVKYGQHPDMFTADLEAIDKLRIQAVNVQEPHSSGIKKLMAYAAQLLWIGGKFPIDIGADFIWYPALGYNAQKSVSQNNLRFELANIVFNLAALYSQLVSSLNRTSADGLREACNYFGRGAGAIAYLRDEIIPEMRSSPPEDMDNITLDCLERLFLAQAQECYWAKAVMDGLRDASIARLAAQLSDYYSAASDLAVKADGISSEWLHHMTAKHHHFAAVAQYRASRDCLEKRKYGEEVARLRDSVACVNEGLKEARYVNKIVLGDLQGLKSRLLEDLKRAEKDNDIIYLEPVPPKSELKLLERANMAPKKLASEVAQSLDLGGGQHQLGKPLFSKLVPYSVHVAASLYGERRDRLIAHSILEAMESLDVRLHELLQSLNLPGALQALEKPLGLPPGLVAHSEEIKQQGGLNRLYSFVEDVAKLKSTDQAIYQEGVNLLQQEFAEDDAARARHGTDRWTRPPSREAGEKLYSQVAEIEGYFKSAQGSDELVDKKIKASEEMLRLVAGPRRHLNEFVPNAQRAAIPPKLEREVQNLNSVLHEANRLESRRQRIIDEVKARAKADDINPDILDEAARLEREYPGLKLEAAQFENFFEQRLRGYEADLERVNDEREAQERVMVKLQEANASFVGAKKGDTSSREREQALQKLENAYFKYKEIVSNLDVGRKFYNDLARLVSRFRDECGSFLQQRRSEAERLQSDISLGLSHLNLSSDPRNQQAPGPPLGYHQTPESTHPQSPITAPRYPTQQQQQQPPPPTQAVPSRQSYGAPLAATTAYPSPSPSTQPTSPASSYPPMPGTWTPTAGIRFGGGGVPGSGPAGGATSGLGRIDSSSRPASATSSSTAPSGTATPRHYQQQQHQQQQQQHSQQQQQQRVRWDATRGVHFG